jgi:uncharacterized protein
MDYSKPLPRITDDNKQYWAYCKNHELRMQKCLQCGYIRFPPGIVCPRCHSMQTEWIKLSGQGKIYSFVIYRRAYHPAYRKDIPYIVAIIQLNEGPRMESNVAGCQPEDIRIDMPVEVSFEDIDENISIPKYKPVCQSDD